MNLEEAKAWLRGERSHNNRIMEVSDPQTRAETLVNIELADAATTQCAYWIVRAHHERLVRNGPKTSTTNPDEFHEDGYPIEEMGG